MRAQGSRPTLRTAGIALALVAVAGAAGAAPAPPLRMLELVAGPALARRADATLAHAARIAGRSDAALALSLRCAALAAASDAHRAELECLTTAAATAQQTGELVFALRLQQRRQALATRLHDPRAAVDALNQQAHVARRQARYHEAEQLARLALEHAQAAWDDRGAAAALSTLSLIHKNRGDYPEALDFETQALERRARVGASGRPNISLLSLAALYEQLEDFDRARDYQARALAAAAHSPDPFDLTMARISMAGLLNDSGPEYAATALALARLGWDDQRRAGNRPGALDARFHVGRALLNLGDVAAARAHLEAVLDEAVALGQRASQAHVWFRLSEARAAEGDLDGAVAATERAARIYTEVGNPHRLAKTYGLLERWHALAGRELEALRYGRERLLLRERLLGAGAMQKVNARIAEYRAARDAAQIDLLRRDNELSALTVERNVIRWQFNALLAAFLAVALAALLVRYRASVRANRRLAAQNVEIEEQRKRLSVVNSRLWVSATTDPLTGLTNRAHAFEVLGALLSANGPRRDAAASVVVGLVDIDHFKRINDRLGHLAGDAALRAVATTLRDALALASVVARLGGEEFLVVLSDSAARAADEHFESARAAVAALGLPGTGALTVSIGWVQGLPGDRVDELIGAADAALYAAKARGRNAVERAPTASLRASTA